MSAPTAFDCERGFHAPLVAHEPIESAGSVEVDYVCPLCGAIEYTQSWTKAAWIVECAWQAAKAELAARKAAER